MRYVASLVALAYFTLETSAQISGLGPPVLPDVLSTLLDAYKPLLSTFAKSNLPATLGNCSDGAPPPNCTNIGPLYEIKDTFYHVKARWISGIDTMRLDNLNMAFDAQGGMTVKLQVNFAQLPTSLLVEACAGSLGCAKFLDSTKSCCGTDKTVAMTATATCNESYPFIQNLAIADATIIPGIGFNLDVLGHPFQVADLTPSIVTGIKTTAGKFFASQGMDLLNKQIQSLFGDKVYCSEASRNAQVPSAAPVTMPPSPTSTNATTAVSSSTSSPTATGNTSSSSINGNNATANATTTVPRVTDTSAGSQVLATAAPTTLRPSISPVAPASAAATVSLSLLVGFLTLM
ncbi:Aste57867_14700 [Aphanomyces stellatus]|uniref:Aste57867_14700 protein n=1 Tax=Aphanomyces stellatus TaxID=120398 RepID=A0A485L1X5_9STRA|nr:hypothetical protein As57867_014645 [Aphanomyces stellatus]VFT91518.1 Aste57867_14700 [Aphanomyces stellatus]